MIDLETIRNAMTIILGVGALFATPTLMVVEAIKDTGLISSNYYKLLAYVVGIAMGLIFGLVFCNGDYSQLGTFAIAGFVSGYSSTSAYDQVARRIDNKPATPTEEMRNE